MSRFTMLTLLVAALSFSALVLPPDARRPAGLALLLTYLTAIGLGVVFIRLRLFVDALCVLPTLERVVALTFDDGPVTTATPPLLDLLDELDVKATFFWVGRNVEQAPELAREVVRRGHGIGNHSYRHTWWLPLASSCVLRREVESAQRAIQHGTGQVPRLFRPPVGLTNPRLASVLRRVGLTCVGWTIRSLDTRAGPPESVVRRVIRRLRPGAIILLHDGAADPQRLVAIVRQLVEELARCDYRFVRLDEQLDSKDRP